MGSPSGNDTSPQADAVWRLLRDGNRRFISGTPMYSRDIASARAAATEQRPVAAVFTCVDSRVTAESLFDCDFGQLVVVRTAGHVADDAAIGSLEFAVTQLAVPLVVVLGHERCGAVALSIAAVRDGTSDDSYLTGRLKDCAEHGLRNAPSSPESAAMRCHVDRTVEMLHGRPGISRARVLGAHYDLDSGLVNAS